MNLLNIFKKKAQAQVEIDHVQEAKDRAEYAVQMFHEANEELSQASATLADHVTREQERIAAAQYALEDAQAQLQTTNELKVRISEFVQ